MQKILVFMLAAAFSIPTFSQTQSPVNVNNSKAFERLAQIRTADKHLVKPILTKFVKEINASRNTTDQKVLLLREAMHLATDNDIRKMIIREISKNKTLLSLIFTAEYLDNMALQQTAVQAVYDMLTNQNKMYGDAVNKIAEKAMVLNKSPKALRQKQELQKQLAAFSRRQGFVSMFNGKDLTGWKGLVENPIARAKMTQAQLAEKQKKADEQMRKDWKAENGVLVFEGKGFDNLVSEKMYGDFELILDWRMEPEGDGGVYLRGSPQVQTWDTSRTDVGAQVGSGGLYNNKIHASIPLVIADNPINEWNTFRITMTGPKVTVYLNGIRVTDNTVLENYWDRNMPIFDKEAIELQAHGTRLEFRNIYVREIPR